MKDLIKNLKKYPVIIYFAVVLYAISIADLFSPVEEYSDLENRKLASFPPFSIKALFDNEYTPKIEDFTEDHFIVRDKWISLKSLSESALGKIENNGVIYGSDGYLFTKFLAPDYAQLEKNIAAVDKFIQNHRDRNITFIAAPTAAGVMKDKLYANSPVADIDYITEYVSSSLGDNFLDVYPALKAHNEEYIYYRTDHHWTTHGAYYAYEQYMNFIGKEPVAESRFEYIDVPDFLGTHYSKSKNYNVVSDTLSYIKNDSQMVINDGKTAPIYDESKLEVRDKYAMFLQGNNGLVSIQGKGSGKMMIIKDSYANCFIPFLTDEYRQIDVFDLRYISVGLDSYIRENDYEQILFLYNCETLLTDTNLPKINLFN